MKMDVLKFVSTSPQLERIKLCHQQQKNKKKTVFQTVLITYIFFFTNSRIFKFAKVECLSVITYLSLFPALWLRLPLPFYLFVRKWQRKEIKMEVRKRKTGVGWGEVLGSAVNRTWP